MTQESTQLPDQVQRFLFDHTAVRGELVQLHQSYQDVLQRHDYPAAIEQQLGQMLAAAALLTATVKLDGTLTLEARGQGDVSLLMAECNTGKQGGDQLRAIARYKGEPLGQNLQDLLNGGQLVITLDPYQGQRYQGIVALDQPSLAACLEGYFTSSEQLPTRIWLDADRLAAGGLLLQQLPDDSHNKDKDAWNRISQLCSTITSEELLHLDQYQLLHRLFHEETLRVFPPYQLSFGCTCSRERIADALASLGESELQQVLEEQGAISTQCHFCNTHYSFSAQDLTEIINSNKDSDRPADSRLH
ncbi:MAG: Hsp33 family molecular chaperone HslO [Marinospirillum sp.]|uniref:Hsp33 family molecular chaperone HslO n=1 Tax=Marinospirillum sp. TaxID=2183934 RepID=UPI0019E96DE0|nr:Hsp33 family molecular chaperone HslO [Marinospirillum sp.]MBE0507112.1 Hsp33 family molecular chaperone HslO [Marinospirillum sp.]